MVEEQLNDTSSAAFLSPPIRRLSEEDEELLMNSPEYEEPDDIEDQDDYSPSSLAHRITSSPSNSCPVLSQESSDNESYPLEEPEEPQQHPSPTNYPVLSQESTLCDVIMHQQTPSPLTGRRATKRLFTSDIRRSARLQSAEGPITTDERIELAAKVRALECPSIKRPKATTSDRLGSIAVSSIQVSSFYIEVMATSSGFLFIPNENDAIEEIKARLQGPAGPSKDV